MCALRRIGIFSTLGLACKVLLLISEFTWFPCVLLRVGVFVSG